MFSWSILRWLHVLQAEKEKEEQAKRDAEAKANKEVEDKQARLACSSLLVLLQWFLRPCAVIRCCCVCLGCVRSRFLDGLCFLTCAIVRRDVPSLKLFHRPLGRSFRFDMLAVPSCATLREWGTTVSAFLARYVAVILRAAVESFGSDDRGCPSLRCTLQNQKLFDQVFLSYAASRIVKVTLGLCLLCLCVACVSRYCPVV
jgi:hypothetical protein